MIYIEPIRVKWDPGKILMNGRSAKEKRDFEIYIAKEYIKLVRKRVDQQKFSAKWAPLSPAYLRYKGERGWSLKTWEATGQLMKELKLKSNMVVGFDNRKKHKVSKQKLLSIARANEYGTLSIPARPLFRLVYWYMGKHIVMYYKKFMGGK